MAKESMKAREVKRQKCVDKYAEKRARLALNADKSGPGFTKSGRKIDITSCWHPSPASPLSNRNGGADWRKNVKNCLNGEDFR